MEQKACKYLSSTGGKTQVALIIDLQYPSTKKAWVGLRAADGPSRPSSWAQPTELFFDDELVVGQQPVGQINLYLSDFVGLAGVPTGFCRPSTAELASGIAPLLAALVAPLVATADLFLLPLLEKNKTSRSTMGDTSPPTDTHVIVDLSASTGLFAHRERRTDLVLLLTPSHRSSNRLVVSPFSRQDQLKPSPSIRTSWTVYLATRASSSASTPSLVDSPGSSTCSRA